MVSLNQTTKFHFNPNSNTNLSGILEIYAHHARNIHNICIYDNQDVYAKFSLTYNPDDTLSTMIVKGGGKNPEFNQHLVINVNQIDAVLKCEMWMMSRAKNFMEDQLLGFVLVPISHIVGKGKITRDFSLSSTDLFHSPAGTVKLSLCLVTNDSLYHSVVDDDCSITSEVVLLDMDKKISEVTLEYSRIEFPDIDVVRENQLMVSEYFGSFLRLGAPNDFEMWSENSLDKEIKDNGSSVKEETIEYECSSLSSLSYSNEVTNQQLYLLTREGNDHESSGSGMSDHDEKVQQVPQNEILKLEDGEESSMQRQIVDMYIKSMQQFTESLAKMKIPMDLDKLEESRVQNPSSELEVEDKKKDGNSRVFYGSRAFF